MIDRTRWPVLVTYSDEGLGHDGHVYKCSGWKKTIVSMSPKYEDGSGGRASVYSNGVTGGRGLTLVGKSYIQRWEHRVCHKHHEGLWMKSHGWARETRGGVGVWVCHKDQLGLFG